MKFTIVTAGCPERLGHRLLFFCSLGLVLLLAACSPKAGSEITATTTSPTPAPGANTATSPSNEQLSPCPKFSEASDPDAITDEYVIYRNLIKTKEYDLAMPRWRKVYAVAPAADGKRNTVYLDGVVFYNELIKQYPDRQAAYADTIQLLYAQARECYPKDGFTAAMQGFDAYYTYPGSASSEEIYELFKESALKDGENLQYFLINPMSALLVEMHDTSYIDDVEAKQMTELLLARLKKGLAECQGPDCEVWQLIQDYAPNRLEYFESVKGFYDCQHFVNKYVPDFEANPTDCDVIQTTLLRLRWAECGTDHPAYKEAEAAYNANCRQAVASSAGPAREGYDCLQSNNYRCAIEKFEQAAEDAEDPDRKARYHLTVAKIYFSHLKNFPQARAAARKAAAAKPHWGEPYLLIGRLYASSGPLCGPGRGFDSQIVVWPAIDMWNRAKSVDPAAAAEANKMINQYTQYMPNREDVFQRSLKVGDTFRVGCWIQENTIIRTP